MKKIKILIAVLIVSAFTTSGAGAIGMDKTLEKPKDPNVDRILNAPGFIRTPTKGQDFKSLDTVNLSWAPASDKKSRVTVRLEALNTESGTFKPRNIFTNITGNERKWKIPRNIPSGEYRISINYTARVNKKNTVMNLGSVNIHINRIKPNTNTDGCRPGVRFDPKSGKPCPPTPDTEGALAIGLALDPADDPNVETSINIPVIGLDLWAEIAPVSVQGLDLKVSSTVGSTTENPAVLINTVKVWDGPNNIAVFPVNNSTFQRDSSGQYYIRLNDINLVVPQDSKKSFRVSFSTNPIDVERVVNVSGYGSASLRVISGNNKSSSYDVSGFSRQHTFKKPRVFSGPALFRQTASSTLYTTSGVNGETLDMLAVFNMNVTALNGVVNKEALSNFTVVFEPVGKSGMGINAQSVSVALVPYQDIQSGQNSNITISAVLSGYHPSLMNGFYTARLLGVLNDDGSNQFITNSVNVIRPSSGMGWRDSLTANTSNAFMSIFGFMFGWMNN